MTCSAIGPVKMFIYNIITYFFIKVKSSFTIPLGFAEIFPAPGNRMNKNPPY